MIASSLIIEDGELGILLDLVWRVGSLALKPISGYARYEWARWMTVFSTRRTGDNVIIFEERVNPGRPEHHLLTRDRPVAFAMTGTCNTNVYASDPSVSFHTYSCRLICACCQLQEPIQLSVGVLPFTFFM